MQRTPTCQNCCKSYGFKDVSKPIGNRIPLLLECGHTFCEGCITKWARLQKTGVLCSECQHSTPLTIEGERGVRAIPPNIYLLGVMTNSKRASYRTDVQKPGRSKLGTKAGLQRAINQFTQEKKAALTKIDTGVKCEECSRATATSSCSKCETVYCSACFERVHSYSVALRKHVPSPVTKKNTETAVGCPDHNNRPLEFYDKDDGQPVCSHCVVTGERQTHAVVPIDEIAKEIQDQFKTSVDEVAPIIKHLDKSVQIICKALPAVKAEKNKIINDIREHFQMLYSALQTREQLLIKEVELNHNGEKILEKMREEVADNLRKARDYVHGVDSMIGQPQTLIDYAKKLRSELESVKEMLCCAVKVISHEDQIRFETGGEMKERISEYGSVSTDGCARFEMKKLSEMNEEELGLESDDSEQELVNAQEEQEDPPDTEPSDPRVQHERTPQSITASRILKANLAYRHELVLVTHIRDPCQFMIQRVADLEQLQIMMNVINIYCDSTENVHDLLYDVKFGDMCCAQFTTDNQWYRARIKTAYSPAHPNTVPTLENNLCVEVQYIDYGNSEWLPLSRLRKMKAEFLNVPELGECCCLAEIVPPFQEEKWPPKAIKAFGSLTGDKPLLMTVVGRKGSKLVVDLRRPEDDEPTQDDDRPVSVRDALVFLEVARFSSPASKPTGIFFPKKTYKEACHVEEGAFVDVLVTYVAAPDEIYVQKLRSEETTELQHIMEEMSKMFGGRRRGTEWSVPWPYKGLVCAARFTEDKIWYRALVTAVNSDETVDVTYVDFGNSEKLTFSEIRKLPDMFLRLPKQALPVCLVDIKPIGEEWQAQDQENISSLLLNRSLVVDVKGVVDEKMSVLLFDTTGARDVCINQFLVQHGYCQTAGLGIVKSPDELSTESQNATENKENEGQPEQTVEVTESVQETANEPDTEQEKESQASSLTEEDRAVSESKAESQASETSSASSDYKELKYKPAAIPERNKFQAGVTFVDSHGYVYAQEVKEGDRTLINIMGTLLERYGKSEDQLGAPSDVTSLFPGLPCVAQFAEDGMWYRASVIKVLEDKVEVSYVDFGNSEVVPLSAIRQEMPFMEVPHQCLQLVLRGIEPKTSDGHWPPEAIRALSQAVVGQDCMATIRGDKLPGYPLVVKLFLPDGSDVAQTLLSKGLVQKSPTLSDEDHSSQFHPRKPGPRKAKPFRSKRSISETRVHANKISSREAECVLAQTELPGDEIRFDVTITHIERPDCLFIQRVPPTEIDKGYADDPDPTLNDATEELRTLEEIMARINSPEYFKKYAPLATAKKGMLCCARYTEDDMWYRAQIQSVEHQRPLEVKVLYVDYGTTEVLKADRLRGFPSELLDLPVQATRCFLADIRPPDTTDGPMMDDNGWPVNSMETLIQLVAGKKLVAKVLFSGPPASVMLYEHSVRDDGCIEEFSIGLVLAQRGLAKSVNYEEPVYAESDSRTEESCESEEKTLEFQVSELKFTSEQRLEMSAETKADSSSINLLDKIPTPERNFPPTKQLLKPAEFTAKVTDTVSGNSDPEVKQTEPSLDGVETSSQTTEGVKSPDEKETVSPPVTSAPMAKVTSANKKPSSVEVNEDSLESAV